MATRSEALENIWFPELEREYLETAVISAYGVDMPISEISRLVGITRRTIHTWLNKYHIPRRVPYLTEWEIITSEGYAVVSLPPGDARLDRFAGMFRGYHKRRILKHRLVMAETLGRPLGKNETVHHIDGDRKNNDPDNLQLRHGDHGINHVLVCQVCGSHDVKAIEI